MAATRAIICQKSGVHFMEKVTAIVQIILPIICTVLLGMYARKKAMFTLDNVQSLQQFVIKVCLPCLLFQSCVTAEIGAQMLSSMVTPILLLVSTLLGFRLRRSKYPYHNLPMAFCCKESGMLGIPLFMVLFGADQAYRMGFLDIAQAIVVYPVMAILSSDAGAEATPKAVVKQMIKSPLIRMSALGLVLNLTGIWDGIQAAGAGSIILDTFSFLSQPVSVIMLFCVGFNFSLTEDNRNVIFRISAVHFFLFALLGLVFQAALFLFPGVDAMTRWAVLLYTFLPASYLTPSLGRSEEDFTVSSGVCSVLTVVCLIVFCAIAAIAS